jgi:hypothetical protein
MKAGASPPTTQTLVSTGCFPSNGAMISDAAKLRLHEETRSFARANDQWAYYQAKNIRSHMYEANSEMAGLIKNDAFVAENFRKKSENQKHGAEVIRVKAEDLEREVEITTRRAGRFDASEIFFEIAIVLCSITLLTGTRSYWRISFISSAVGIVFMVSSFLIR